MASLSTVVAAGVLAAGGGDAAWVPGVLRDPGFRRELLATLVAAVALVGLLPRGRRRLAVWPLLLVLLATMPILSALAFHLVDPGGSDAAPRWALFTARFFLLASLMLSLVSLVMVVAWERIGRPLPQIFLDVFRWLAVGVALVVVLYEVGVDARDLFAGSAVFTAVLGFALKDTLGNVFAGLAIQAERPFTLGDWIQYDANPAHIGRVVEINWRATKVITLDEAYVVIPNGQLAQASIRNFTKPDPWSRRSLFVVTPYDASPQRVQRIILDAIRGSFGVLDHPAPSVVTNDFKERGVEHWVRFFTTDFDKRDRVDGMARDRIWFALARHGIEIPVATQAIRLQQLPPPPAGASPETLVERRADVLRGVALLADLDDAQRRRLAEENRELLFAKGEAVVHQGDDGDCMFVVLDGAVEVTAAERDRGPVSLSRLGPGAVFGEVSLLTGAVRSATVTATEETRVLEISKRSLAHLLAAEHGLVEKLGAALAERLDARHRALEGDPRRPVAEPDLFQKIRDFFSL